MSPKRSFCHKCLAAVLSVSLLAPLLAACGAAPTAPTTGPTGQVAATPVPKPEGVLRVGLSALSREVLDPYEDSGTGNMVISLIFDNLVGAAADGTDLGPVRGLAAGWEQKSDSSGWTFSLRKGVPWDKGYGEVTAEDVKFSLDRMIYRDGGLVTDRQALKAGIKDIVVVDPYSLTIDTNGPFLDLPYLLSAVNMATGAIVPKKAIEQLGEKEWQRNPVASGPYRMVEHQSGSFFKFEARPDYWGGMPRYKEIYTYNVPEDATREAMLKRGELDVAEVSIPQLKGLEAAGFQLVEKKGGLELIGYVHNQWEGAMSKKEVRQALNLAVNKKELADKLFESRARPTGGNFPSFTLGGKDLPPTPYDPEQAKKLLAQAGYPNGFDLALIARPDAPLPLVAEALAGYYRAVGINAIVKPIDGPTATSLWREGKLKDGITPFIGANRPFVTAAYLSRFAARGVTTLVRDADPELERLVQTASKSKTLQELAQNQGNVQQHAYDQARDVNLVSAGRWFAARPNVNTAGWNGGGHQMYALGWWQLVLRP